MERNLPDKKAFARWYIEKDYFLKDKDVMFLSVSGKDLDKVEEIFADFKFNDGKSLKEKATEMDTEQENIILLFSTDVAKEEYRVEFATEHVPKSCINSIDDITDDIDWHYSNEKTLNEYEVSFNTSSTGLRPGDTIIYEDRVYKAAWMVDDIFSPTGRLGLIPEDKNGYQMVVRFIGDHNLFDLIEKVQDKTVEVPKYISKGLAREIVEFMESYDKAFGYTDELEGQSSKEEWINTVQEAFSRGEGKGYVDTVLRLKEDTTIAMKQAIKIETELIKCKEKENGNEMVIVEKTEEIVER